MRILTTLVASFLATSLAAQTLEELTASLAKATTLDGPMVGDGGDKSDTFRTYEAWRDLASIDQLRAFTKHENAIVRGYAVRALVAADAAQDFAAIAREHLLDVTKVTTFEGCCQAEQMIGDVIFELVRPKLSEAQVLDFAEELLARKSPLAARENALRTLHFRDAMLHTVRSLVDDGDAAAAIALARYRLPPDAARLTKLLRTETPFADNAWFVAADIHRDPSLLAPLLALEAKARRHVETDNFSRLYWWLHAIAAQQSQEAGAFLARFLDETTTSASFRERDVLDTLKRAIVDFPDCAAFDGVRDALRRRHQNVR